MNCPDDGTCHHKCVEACFRVLHCEPLTSSGWEEWPEALRREHQANDVLADMYRRAKTDWTLRAKLIFIGVAAEILQRAYDDA